jgi:hypothetical protein
MEYAFCGLVFIVVCDSGLATVFRQIDVCKGGARRHSIVIPGASNRVGCHTLGRVGCSRRAPFSLRRAM